MSEPRDFWCNDCNRWTQVEEWTDTDAGSWDFYCAECGEHYVCDECGYVIDRAGNCQREV